MVSVPNRCSNIKFALKIPSRVVLINTIPFLIIQLHPFSVDNQLQNLFLLLAMYFFPVVMQNFNRDSDDS